MVPHCIIGWLTRQRLCARIVSPAPRTDPALSPLHDAPGLDADLLGRPDGVCAAAIDTYGIELIHPMREGRSPPADWPQRPLEPPLDCRGQTVSPLDRVGGLMWGGRVPPRTSPITPSRGWIRQVDGRMIVLSDTAFHAAEGVPANLKLCQRGEWQDRLPHRDGALHADTRLPCQAGHASRVGGPFQARLAFTMAAFNVLVLMDGFQPRHGSGFVPLSIAEFSL